jgi:D-lactate dehydrogenase
LHSDIDSRALIAARLLTFPNVLITSHQAFLTKEALAGIARVTLENVTAFEPGAPLANQVRAEHVLR